ncbi:MAG: divalent-cation tolerance protein CutA [Candidatus Nanohalobium sp.]
MKLVYVTFPDEKTCREISEKIVSERLAAGVNFDSMNSIYWWNDEIQKDSEYRALFKTSEDKVEELRERVLKLHPYDTPCIAAFEAEANEDFERWVSEETEG